MSTKHLLSICCLGLLVTACQSNDEGPSEETTLLRNQTITVGSLEREYHIQLPGDSRDKPLVLILHGHGGSHDQSIGEGRGKAVQEVWLDVADREGFIAVVPNGTLGPEDTRGWNDCRNDARGNPDTDDVRFLDELLEKLHDDYNYDRRRVYVAGVSNGALMTIRLVQEIPQKIAAFAAIVNSAAGNSVCMDSDVPVSALFMNGTADPLVPYDGGQIASDRGLALSTDATVDYWIARNGTSTTAIEESLADVDPRDGSNVIKYVYGDGANNTEVVLYKVIGGGHTEPSLKVRYANLYLAIVGTQNGDIEMAEEVWTFFSNKSK